MPLQMISIHAPVKGATRRANLRKRPASHFNPLSREGSDVVDDQDMGDGLDISIHAPVKGATTRRGFPAVPAMDFNPRSREGSDCLWSWERLAPCNFNPRSREGSDSIVAAYQLPEGISIHAPVKGAT